MDPASLGRRKLEEIRQKRAAEKMNKIPGKEYNTVESEASLQIQNLERELQSLHLQVKRSQEELQEQNRRYSDCSNKLQQVEEENKALREKMKDMEAAQRRLHAEKDAGIAAREDANAHIRILKKQLQEAEEEQYKAEQDNAALREELDMLHRREELGSSVVVPSLTSEQFQALEQELETVKDDLQKAQQQLYQESQKISGEKDRVMTLMKENEQLKSTLLSRSKEGQSEASSTKQQLDAPSSAHVSEDRIFSSVSTSLNLEKSKDYSKNDMRLREMASMVERLEIGRQKLLTEIDAQSLEIERLFVENSSLGANLEESARASQFMEKQIQECMQQNVELRAALNELRMEHARLSSFEKPKVEISNDEGMGEKSAPQREFNSLMEENNKLKIDLAMAKGQGESLKAQALQLSVELSYATKTINSLSHLYKPLLVNIENKLLQLKQSQEQFDTLL